MVRLIFICILIATGLLGQSLEVEAGRKKKFRKKAKVHKKAVSAYTVSGAVVDATSGAPIVGVTVAHGQQSVLTDKAGNFRFSVPAVKLHTAIDIVVYHDSFVAHALQFTLSKTNVPLRIALTPISEDVDEGTVIEIVGNIIPTPSRYELGAEQIRRVPGTGNDTLKSLQTMPGVSRVPFGMGGIVLRGTSPRDSNVYLDGIEVPLLYHFGGLSSFYPSSTLQSLQLVSGGYSSEYGRGQGGVVLIESRSGHRDKWRETAELSMFDLALQGDGPIGKYGSLSVGLRRSLIDALLPLISTGAEITTAPRYYDAQIRYDTRLWSGAKLVAQLLLSDDQIALTYGDRSNLSFRYGTRFTRLGLKFEQEWQDATLTISPWLGTDAFTLASTSQTMTSDNDPYGLRAVYKKKLQYGKIWGHLRVGTEVSAGAYVAESSIGNASIGNRDSYVNTALWIEPEIRVDRYQLKVQPGLRMEHYGLSEELVIDPRLMVTHEFDSGWSLRESIGLYHQPPSVADKLWGNESLQSSYSLQASFGGHMPVSEEFSVSATGFYSELQNLAIDDPTVPKEALERLLASKVGALASSREFLAKQFGTFSTLRNTGDGRNYGLELMARYIGERGFAWLALTESRALRRDGAIDEDWRSYVLEQPHVFTLVGSYLIAQSWQIGARFRYASGNPYTPILGGEDLGDGQFVPVYGDELSENLGDFWQADVRVDKTWQFTWGTIAAFVDIQNVTRRKNIEGRLYEDDYSNYEETAGLPLFPAFGVVFSSEK